MKRIFAILLTVAMLFSLLALCVAAEETELENQELEIDLLDKAPVIDGEITSGEYGKYPVHTYKNGEDNPGFKTSDCYELTDDPDLQIDFYAGWTETDLYLAWKVKTKYDFRIPEGLGDGYMYEYCCVQFILTTGAPNKSVLKYQTADWSGDYLEIGCCLKDDGLSYKVCWSQPLAANNGLTLADWEFAGSREGDITTYEVRLPWEKTGVQVVGTDAQFGLTYAVGAQEQFNNVAMGMIEYQDAILWGKHADSAAIVTLKSGDKEIEQKEVKIAITSKDEAPEGKLPEGLEATILAPDKVNAAVGSEGCALISKPSNLATYGCAWSYCMLLRPDGKIDDVDGYYTVVDAVQGAGETPVFAEEFKKGDMVIAFHSDGGAGSERKAAAMALPIGQQVYLFGFETDDNGELGFKYSNCCMIPILDPATPLFGTWYADEIVLVFNEDKTGSLNGEAFEYSVDDKGNLKIDGEKVAYEIKDGKLVIEEMELEKVNAADLTALNDAITLAEGKNADDYEEASFASLTEALNAAKELVAQALDSRNQAEIDEAAATLNAAIEALVEKELVEPSEEPSEEPSAEPSAAESTEESKEDEGGLSTGALVGIIAGAVVLVGGGAAAGIVASKKKKK